MSLFAEEKKSIRKKEKRYLIILFIIRFHYNIDTFKSRIRQKDSYKFI